MINRPETSDKSLMERLRLKWGLRSYFQVGIVLLVFSLTGMTVVLLRKSLFAWLNFGDETPLWLKAATYLVFIFPAYQALILVYGAIFGQFRFFWEKEKQMVRALGRLFRKSEGSGRGIGLQRTGNNNT